MADDLVVRLPPLAARRMHGLLPELLALVRARRRRRHARRAAAMALVLAAPIAAYALRPGGPAAPHPAAMPIAAPYTIVATDATVVVRCVVATVDRAEWYVDDAELQQLLRANDRDAGLLRIGDRVLVSKAAIDPWPVLARKAP